MSLDSFSNSLNSCLKDKNVLHLKNIFNVDLNWNDVVNLIDYKYSNESISNNNNLMVNRNNLITDILPQGQLHWHIWNSENYLKIKDIVDIFLRSNINHNKKIFSAKLSVNLAGNKSLYNAHKDFQNVLSIQMIGSVEYRIYQDINANYEQSIDVSNLAYDSYILNKGDALLVPSGRIHQVFVTQPRSTLLLDF